MYHHSCLKTQKASEHKTVIKITGIKGKQYRKEQMSEKRATKKLTIILKRENMPVLFFGIFIPIKL